MDPIMQFALVSTAYQVDRVVLLDPGVQYIACMDVLATYIRILYCYR